MTTRADTIARHLNATTLCEADRRLLHLAFLECLGGAAVAGEAVGPWVVRVTVRGSTRWHSRTGPAESFLNDASTYDARAEADAAAAEWGTDYAATVLPLAEAERMEAAATLASLPAHTQKVLAELGDEEPSAEVLAADDSPDSAPAPPKPAGWVVRVGKCWAAPSLRTTSGDRLSQTGRRADAVTFPTREEAETWARRCEAGTWSWGYVTLPEPLPEVLPVDAAGNAIEAEDISATLRREECERKAARQAGEEREWEAMRADLDAALTERADLRIALRAVEAERDALNAAKADLRHALRQIAGLVGGAVSLGASTEMHCAVADEVRAAVGQLRAERDALAAEVQRAKEQKPVRWAFLDETGTVVCTTSVPEPVSAVYRVAPLYLAPVVRDHSGVIAQCEEALRESSGLVIATDVMRPALRAALSALRGAS